MSFCKISSFRKTLVSAVDGLVLIYFRTMYEGSIGLLGQLFTEGQSLRQHFAVNMQKKHLETSLCFPQFKSNLPLLTIYFLAIAKLYIECLLEFRQLEASSQLGFWQGIAFLTGVWFYTF